MVDPALGLDAVGELYLAEGRVCAIRAEGLSLGALPEGVSRTSIQDDFYRQLKELRL